jgi:phosphopantetheinyl transferase (holo-ACP synthase)
LPATEIRSGASNGWAAAWPQQYPILADAHGRPGVDWSGRAGTPPALSISHCRGYAAALARVGGACGLDMEPVAPRLATVRARFTTPAEIALLHALPDPLTRLAVVWTAKEAVKKCYLHDEPTFVSRISLIAATIDPADPVLTLRCRITGRHDPTPTVRVTAIDSWMLACTEAMDHA